MTTETQDTKPKVKTYTILESDFDRAVMEAYDSGFRDGTETGLKAARAAKNLGQFQKTMNKVHNAVVVKMKEREEIRNANKAAAASQLNEIREAVEKEIREAVEKEKTAQGEQLEMFPENSAPAN